MNADKIHVQTIPFAEIYLEHTNANASKVMMEMLGRHAQEVRDSLFIFIQSKGLICDTLFD